MTTSKTLKTGLSSPGGTAPRTPRRLSGEKPGISDRPSPGGTRQGRLPAPHPPLSDRQETETAAAAYAELTHAELVQLPDAVLLTRLRGLPKGSTARSVTCEILVGRYEKLVRSCVRAYQGSPEPAEDLMQVGYVGLIKAINNYDPAAGTGLSGYAIPCVSGEIKRHFRDKRWQVHVRRSTQELVLELRKAAEQLTHQLGRPPSDGELARRLGVTAGELADARRADMAFSTYSLDAPAAGIGDSACLGELLGAEDADLEQSLDMHAVAAHWGELPEREQQILVMRFYGNLTQAEIGTRLGISQMHVSRLLAQALGHLRSRLLSPDDMPSPRAP